jgi:release factor glutamine methyltransferase
VFAEDEAALLLEAAREGRHLTRMLADRQAGTPLEQVLGWAAFRGLRIRVDPGVFVPRARTSFLVDRALDHLARHGLTSPVVLDLCCGSGAAGAAVEHVLPGSVVHAADLDPRSVACARRNLAHPGLVVEGDLFAPLPPSLRGDFDVILANAPYVPTDEIDFMPQEARLYEPRSALDGGVDGLRIQARVAREAPAWLAPGGLLLIETSVRQATRTRALLVAAGLRSSIERFDDLDATVAVGLRDTEGFEPG